MSRKSKKGSWGNFKNVLSKVSDQEPEECDQFKLKNERKKPKID